jgi:two-component system chemotaxis response regulator CheB
MIRVLIAEDSEVVQRILATLLSEEPEIQIVGRARSGIEAVEMFRRLKPDLVTMDICMPEMDGLEATRRILQEYPARIVIISSVVNTEGLSNSFDAIGHGAVDLIEKPQGVLYGDYREIKRALVKRIREIAGSSPQNHLSWIAPPIIESAEPTRKSLAQRTPDGQAASQLQLKKGFVPAVICIGGSTGAPAVIEKILSQLSSDYPVPIAVAQHIFKGFVEGMVAWLDKSLQLKVKVAASGDALCRGRALIAPDNAHMQIQGGGAVQIVAPTGRDIYVPSVNGLFNSIATVYGAQAIGIILSGTGNDGAEGLGKMREAGAITVAQSENSALIYRMLSIAVSAGAAIVATIFFSDR